MASEKHLTVRAYEDILKAIVNKQKFTPEDLMAAAACNMKYDYHVVTSIDFNLINFTPFTKRTSISFTHFTIGLYIRTSISLLTLYHWSCHMFSHLLPLPLDCKNLDLIYSLYGYTWI